MMIIIRKYLPRIAGSAAALAAAALTFAACSSPAPTSPPFTSVPYQPEAVEDSTTLYVTSVSTIDSLEREWHDHAPASYSYGLHWLCYCSTRGTPYVGVRMRAGSYEVHSMKDQHVLDSATASLYPTIDKLFSKMREAVKANAYKVIIRVDPILHYPTYGHIDYSAYVADDEFPFFITNLRELP